MNKVENTSNCSCGTANKALNACPTCNSKGTVVSGITIKSQLKKEKFENIQHQKDDFNFCNTKKCDTVYYSNDGKEFYNQEDIKSKVAVKNEDLKTPLCYCKKLLKQNVVDMINNKEENIAQKVKDIVSDGKHFCEKANPRGVCCTEDIINFLADYGIDYNEKSSNENSSCGESSCGDNTPIKDNSSCCGDSSSKKSSSCCG